MQSKTPIWISLIIISIITIFCIWAGINSIKENINIRMNGKETWGVVRNYEASRDNDGHYIYYPIIEFYDTDKNLIKLTVSSLPKNPKIGAEFKVFYNPKNPKNAVADSFMYMWGAALGFWLWGFFGSVFVVAIIIYILKTRRKPYKF